MGRNRPSNEGAPQVPGEERSGPPWGRIAALLIGLILLAVLIPLACQAFGGSGDSGSSGSGKQDRGSGRSQDRGSGRQKGVDEAASAGGKADAASAAGGSGAASGGSSKDAQAGNAAAGRGAGAPGGDGTGATAAGGSVGAGGTGGAQGATGNASGAQAGAAGGDTTGVSAAGGGASHTGGGTTGARAAAGGADEATGATARIAGMGGVRSPDGRTVTVPRAVISGTGGWIAIHADDNGEPGDVLGHAPLREGTNTDVVVPLDRPVGSTQKLSAVVHADEPADGRYTFPDGDPPATAADGNAAVEPFRYAVAGGSARASVQGGASGGVNGAGEPLPNTGGPMIPVLAAGIALLVAGGLLLAGGLPTRGPRLASRTSEPDPRAARVSAAKRPVGTSKNV